MYFKKVILGFFALALLHTNVFATDQLETSGGLITAPDWVLHMGDGPYSAVGMASIVRFIRYDKKLVSKIDVDAADNEAMQNTKGMKITKIDIDVAEYEAIRKAKDQIYQQIYQYVQGANKVLIAKTEPTSYAIYKQIEELKPADIWITNDGCKIFVLIKPSKSIAQQIQKLVKSKEPNSVPEQSEVKEPASIKDTPEWVLKNNNSFTAVGIAPTVLTKVEGLVSADIKLTKSEAINKAKEKLAKEIEMNLSSTIDKNIKTLIEKGEIKNVVRYSTIASKIADTAEIEEMWMNRQVMCVLIKLPQYSIKKIEQLKKLKLDRGSITTN